DAYSLAMRDGDLRIRSDVRLRGGIPSASETSNDIAPIKSLAVRCVVVDPGSGMLGDQLKVWPAPTHRIHRNQFVHVVSCSDHASGHFGAPTVGDYYHVSVVSVDPVCQATALIKLKVGGDLARLSILCVCRIRAACRVLVCTADEGAGHPVAVILYHCPAS